MRSTAVTVSALSSTTTSDRREEKRSRVRGDEAEVGSSERREGVRKRGDEEGSEGPRMSG
jgi:hypothetical protein